MSKPFITVVVPMYKVERYIKVCIDSILSQTFQNFEIIIVEDASPDNCYEICQKLYGKNNKIRILRHEKNLGLGLSRNTGIAKAEGKYIYFVDSDDAILPETLAKLAAAASMSNAEVIHMSGWYETTQDDDKPMISNLRQRWEGSNQQGFLSKDIPTRIEKEWINYNTWSMAWACMYKRSFLQDNGIRFQPIISEDELFCVEIYLRAKSYFKIHECLYIYRRRESSIIGDKSLRRAEKGLQAIFIGYKYLDELFDKIPSVKDDKNLQQKIFKKFIDMFSALHLIQFYELNDSNTGIDNVVEKYLAPVFRENTSLVKNLIHNLAIHLKQIYHLQGQNNQLLQHINKQKSQGFSPSHLINSCRNLKVVPNKIVFINGFNGRGYGCNPKYIAEEIIKQNLQYDLVWIVRDLNSPMPARIRKVSLGSIESVFELSTAKVIITNVKNMLPFVKKPEQFMIMTWHSNWWLKYIEGDCESQLPPAYVTESKNNSAITDLMIASSEKQVEEIYRALWYKGKVIKSGLPRNDIFFRDNRGLILQIKNSLKISQTDRIVLYAPTFRRNPADNAILTMNYKKLTKILGDRFGGKWVALVRLHPNLADIYDPRSLDKSAIDVTNYSDIQELEIVADILITDYSSVTYDFMIQKKPVFFLAKDADTYSKERQLKPEFYQLPYEINKSEEELFHCIEKFNETETNRAVNKFLEMLKPFDKGHASEALVSVINSVIKNPIQITDDAGSGRKIKNWSLSPGINDVQNNWLILTYLKENYTNFLNNLPEYRGSNDTPKIFWWCWLQGENNAPQLCKICLSSLRQNYPDYKINIISFNNMEDYVQFPEHIKRKFNAGQISPTHFTDLLRLELLVNYGGIWIDSTVFCTGHEENYLRCPLFIFQGFCRNNHAHLGSSWLIVSEKNNPILRTARDLLYKFWFDNNELGTGAWYFLFHCVFTLAAQRYLNIWQKVPIFSNIPPHMLQIEFFKPYSEKRFEQIKSMSHFHKLTWKYPPDTFLSEKITGTMAEYILSQKV